MDYRHPGCDRRPPVFYAFSLAVGLPWYLCWVWHDGPRRIWLWNAHANDGVRLWRLWLLWHAVHVVDPARHPCLDRAGDRLAGQAVDRDKTVIKEFARALTAWR